MRHPFAPLAFLAALVLVSAVGAGAAVAVAEAAIATAGDGGHVELPRDVYDRLIAAARPQGVVPRPVPAAFTLGNAEVTVEATARDDGSVSAAVSVDLAIEVLDEDWVLVPVLALGTPVAEARVGGAEVQLVASPLGLAWATRGRGKYQMSLRYQVDAARSQDGLSLAVATPAAASMRLVARLPQPDLDVSVVPAAGVSRRRRGEQTEITATLPTTNAVQIAWRLPRGEDHAMSRARYSGRLDGDVLTFEGRFDVEVLVDGAVSLDLLPRHVTLREVSVDGEAAAILVRGERFATLVRGRGRHTVSVGFQVPVVRGDGPPQATVDIPAVPVSRFDLVLPGRKDVTSTGAASVATRVAAGETQATIFAPMCPRLTFSWTEAVPEQLATEVRANAGVYHLARAEEGVLFVRALVRYEISRGEASVVHLRLPEGVQVERVADLAPVGAAGTVADWRLGPAADGGRTVTIYLNRPLTGELTLAVDYDRPLAGPGALPLPLVSAPDAQRRRGMIALLQGRELGLEPVRAAEAALTRVGENQLPAFVRAQLELPVAHTFKYVESPVFEVAPAVPERRVGRFDATVDTLVSLGEVTLEATATIEVDVKSGGIETLQLSLPPGVTLLGLSGPSIRNHEAAGSGEDGAAAQTIDIAFTQAMEGQLRVEVRYEQILAADAESVAVPTVRVLGAEVEQGRIAVEALAAVEIQATGAEHLTVLDPGDLPRQLLLRTSNPILLAYKYVRAEPRPSLRLAVERHQLLGVQEAVIDQAEYKTLITKGGMAVTTARFLVRNSRKQFLRLALPPGARVWSVFVDGRPEKPALAGDTAGAQAAEVLIKIKNATDGFPVEVVYEVAGDALGSIGSIETRLPQPDILVTDSHWDVFLPADLRYGAPRTSMEAAAPPAPAAAEEMRRQMALEGASANGESPHGETLLIEVPAAGVHYRFSKLYANQGDSAPSLRIGYATRGGARLGSAASVAGTVLVWLAIAAWLLSAADHLRRPAAGLGLGGLAIIAAMLGIFHVSATPVIVTSALAVAAIAAALAARWLRARNEAVLDF